jgi:NADH dehydrogenase
VRVRRGLAEDVSGCSAVIHLVGIIRERPAAGVTFERVHVDGTRNMLAAAAEAGVRRFVHMSALGTRPGARSRYHQTKWAAEEAVRASGLAWTIFRPSIIYGRGDAFVTVLAGLVRRLPVVPVIGTGQARLQPVPVEQVAEALARSVTMTGTEKQVYQAVGPDAVTFVQLLELVAAALGRPGVRTIRIPTGLVRPVARLLHRVPGFPITPDQLLMLEEDNIGDGSAFYQTFGLAPVPLAAGLQRMLA